MVQSGRETERFDQLTVHYMSEEESDDESDTITVHRPHWRSSSMYGLHLFMELNIIFLEY